jgi:acetylornithine/succinyldiaminopimelate/putrescine aminotransferase
VRISPPLVITEAEAQQAMDLMQRVLAGLLAPAKKREPSLV